MIRHITFFVSFALWVFVQVVQTGGWCNCCALFSNDTLCMMASVLDSFEIYFNPWLVQRVSIPWSRSSLGLQHKSYCTKGPVTFLAFLMGSTISLVGVCPFSVGLFWPDSSASPPVGSPSVIYEILMRLLNQDTLFWHQKLRLLRVDPVHTIAQDFFVEETNQADEISQVLPTESLSVWIKKDLKIWEKRKSREECSCRLCWSYIGFGFCQIALAYD